jgi:hypothetical protein
MASSSTKPEGLPLSIFLSPVYVYLRCNPCFILKINEKTRWIYS